MGFFFPLKLFQFSKSKGQSSITLLKFSSYKPNKWLIKQYFVSDVQQLWALAAAGIGLLFLSALLGPLSS